MNLDGLVLCMNQDHDAQVESEKLIVVSTSADLNEETKPPLGPVAMIQPPVGRAKDNICKLLMRFKLWLLDKLDTCLDEGGNISVRNC